MRVDQVGSLLRPAKLKETFVRHSRGLVSDEELIIAQDEAIRELIALEEAHRLAYALLGRGVRRERALQHLQLRQSGEDVLHGTIVHIEHDALELALARGEQAAGRGARLSFRACHRDPRGGRTPGKTRPGGASTGRRL